MRAIHLTSVLCGVLAACSFNGGNNGAPDGGGDDDAPPTLSVSFDTATTLTDEHGAPMIPVHLSQPATVPISVTVGATGGTATAADYTLQTATLTFAPGETAKTADLQIVDDGLAEPDETIELSLSAPTGGAALGATATNTVTISASVLPRVSFVTATSSAAETAATMIGVQLDTASPLQITVDYTLGGTATQGTDYQLAPGTVTFEPQAMAKSLALGEKTDAKDEDDETVIATLTNPVNAIVSSTEGVHTHTIVDVDAAPTVTISVAPASVGEAVGTANFTITLSAKSGKTISVPVTADATSTAAATADYTFTSPVTIPPDTLSVQLPVAIVDDLIDEPDETLIAKLGTPTNATLGGATMATLTIIDNDLACYGSGTFKACFTRTPTGTKALSGTIDTSPGSSDCNATQPVGWTAAGQVDACVISAATVNIATVAVLGSRPLVIVADGAIAITGGLDASSSRIAGRTGPGAPFAPCLVSIGSSPSVNGGSGGAGGTFMTIGGPGGKGNSTGAATGGGISGDPLTTSPLVLRAGCSGSVGGGGDPAKSQVAGAIGDGGGAVYLAAGTSISIGGTGIDASGGSAAHSASPVAGGSGGGSGGMIVLDAPAISVTGTAKVFANGGGAESGGNATIGGTAGSDPTFSAAAGGVAPTSAGDGGAGFFATNAGGAGGDGLAKCGGGGGGGGGGYIKSSVALPAAATSAGKID